MKEKSQNQQLTYPCRIFASLNFFLILAIFVLVFSHLIGLNLPKYYPLLGQWNVASLEGPAMGFFGAIGFSLLVAVPLAVGFYLALPFKQKYLEIRYKTFKNWSTLAIVFGILYFVAKEWKKWGIEKMSRPADASPSGVGFSSGSLLGAEFWLFVFILFLFLVLLKTLLFLEKKIFE